MVPRSRPTATCDMSARMIESSGIWVVIDTGTPSSLYPFASCGSGWRKYTPDVDALSLRSVPNAPGDMNHCDGLALAASAAVFA